MSYSIVQGAIDPSMLIDLTVNGQPTSIGTGATAQLSWLKPDGTLVVVALVIVDDTTVMRDWSAGDTDVVGTHQAKVIVTRPTARPEIFPSDESHVVWSVVPALPEGDVLDLH